MSFLDIRNRKTSDPQAQLIAKIIQRQLRVTASETQVTDQGPRRLMRTLFDKALTKDDPYFKAIVKEKTAANFKLPFEPDGDLLRLWLKFDTGGNSLPDYSGFGDKNIAKFVTAAATKPLTLYKGPDDGISGGGELCSLFNGINQAIRISDAGYEASEGQNSNIEISSFNTNTYQGFTIWCRFIPLRLGKDIHDKNRTLFFKTDEDSISNGYTAQIDPDGNVLFFVKLNNVVYSAWASSVITASTFGDYSSQNYNPRNYITDANFEPDTSASSFIDLTFTFTFATNAMKIFKNGVDVTTAGGNLPAGSDPNFPGEFVPGTVPESNQFVQVYNVPKGTETDYTAYLSAPSGPSPEFTNVYNVPIPTGGTGGGGYTDVYGPVIGDQYWNLDGTGGGGGYTDVYSVAQGSSYVNLDDTRTRSGEVFASGSSLLSDVITQAVFVLKKTGSPSGTGSVVIRKGTDDSIAATIGTIDVSTITTSYASYTFTNDSNSYALAANDRIMFEHSGGTTSSYVTVNRQGVDAFDGANSFFASYDGSSYHDSTTRDTAGIYRTGTAGGAGGGDRCGERCGGASSSLIGKIITQIELVLKKTGSPTGNASVVIRKESDDSVAVTIGTLDVTTLTGSDQTKTFTNDSNTYALGQGDKILVEHSGGTSSNYIQVKRTSQNAFDGSNTYFTSYKSAAYTDDLTKDLAGTFRTGSAGGGGGGYYTDVYNIPAGSSYLALDGTTRIRGGEIIADANSSLLGKKITQVDAILSKTGSPTGNASVVIRRGTDDSIAVTIGTIDVSTLTTSFAAKTITNNTNTYALQIGDKIMIEYSGGTASNYISINRNTTTLFDGGISTYWASYDGTSYHNFTDRSMAAVFRIGAGSASLQYGNLDNNTQRQAIYLATAQSALIGKTITRATVFLKKVGSPTGILYVRLIKGSDGTFATTLGTIDVATLSTAVTDYSFLLTTNAYVLQQGDYIGLYYNNGTASNYVQVALNDDIFDGANTTKAAYSSVGVWSYQSANDLCGQLYTGGGTAPPPPPPTPPPPDTFPTKDKFGVAKIYSDDPSKIEQLWEMGATNLGSDSRVRVDGTLSRVADGVYQLTSSSARINVYTTNPRASDQALQEVIGDDWTLRIQKGYTLDTFDWRDFELTTYWKVLSWNGGSDEMSIYGRGGRHTDGWPQACLSTDYKGQIQTAGNARFAKEYHHVSGNTGYAFTPGTRYFTVPNTTNVWIGQKTVVYDVFDPQTNQTYVKVEVWCDTEGGNDITKQNWRLMAEITDKGSWGEPSDTDYYTQCNAPNHQQIFLWGGPSVVFRVDNCTVQHKWTSARPIRSTRASASKIQQQQPSALPASAALTVLPDRDVFGIDKLYQSDPAKTSEDWFMSDLQTDPRVAIDGTITNLGGGVWEGNVTSSMTPNSFRVNVRTTASNGFQDSFQTERGEDWVKRKAAGFTGDIRDFRNVEMTVYWLATEWSADDEMSPYVRGGAHHDGWKLACIASDYKGQIRRNGTSRLVKQYHHESGPNGYTFYNGTPQFTLTPRNNIWTGHKFCCYDKIRASDGKLVVRLEVWADESGNADPNLQNWRLMNYIEDDGNLDEPPNTDYVSQCNATPLQQFLWGSSMAVFRIDMVKVHVKKMSIRNIVGAATPVTPPPEPPSSPSTLGRSRVGIELDTNNTTLRGKKITKAQFWLKKVGNPTGVLSCVVRRGTDDSIRTVLGTMPAQSVSSIVNTLYSFTNTSAINTYTLQPYDKISLEYSSGDSNNKIYVLQNNSSTTDCFEVDYDGSVYRSTVAKDIAGILFTGGEAYTGDMPPESFELPDYIHDLILSSGRGVQSGFANVIFAEARIYRKALSVAEALALYTNRVTINSNITYGNSWKIGFGSFKTTS